MESCNANTSWNDKKTHQTYLKPDSGYCLHYYFYFILPEWGLCHLRVPTWAPFRLQFYYNGHNALAAQLTKKGIGFQLVDNAFVQMDDFIRAQKMADTMDVKRLHRQLDQAVRTYCPILRHFPNGYHWSLTQVEYATDIVFRRQRDLQAVYAELIRTAIHSVKPENIATFL